MNRILATIAYMALAVAAYVASAPILASILSYAGTACTYDLTTTFCSFGTQDVYDPAVYGTFATITSGLLLWARLYAHERPWYPLIATFALISLGAMAYDTVFGLPILSGAKLVNDTFNTLRFAVLGSFLLVFAFGKHIRYAVKDVVLAILVSMAGIVAAGVVFETFSGHVIGATQMMVLFLVYAFGGFSIHLMAVSMMFAKGTITKNPANA